MAKVKGPLMSMEASGAYGGTLVFGQRKGASVVRKLVTPSNPQSQGQEDARNIVRVGGVLQRWAKATALIMSGKTGTDRARIAAIAPSNQTWNSYLVQLISGKQGVTYTAARAAFALLTEPQKTAWNDAAAALSPALTSAAQTSAGGVAATALTAGEVFFIYVYGLASAGLATSPGAVPTVYA